jgi:hypothetical protein
MSAAEEISLLGHLRTPILVGDPDGCIVYANPTFRERFGGLDDDPVGQPLAMLFGGGAREVVLSATAEVLQRGQAARLQLREAGRGYTGLCSPIEAEDDRVGVVMVLLEEQSISEHVAALADSLFEPIGDALQGLGALSAAIGDSLTEEQKQLLDRTQRSIDTAQKWTRELGLALRGGKAQPGRFDVAGSIMRVVERMGQEDARGPDLEILMPPNLPRVAGAAAVFERALTQLVRQRREEAKSDEPLTLLARTLGGEQPKGVIVSLVDQPDDELRATTGAPPEAVVQGLAQMGGEALCIEDSLIGRVTSMRMAIASG